MKPTPPSSPARRTCPKQSLLAGTAMAFPAVLRAERPNGMVNAAVVGVDGLDEALHTKSAG